MLASVRAARPPARRLRDARVPPADAAERTGGAAAAPPSPPSILVVDDDPDVLAGFHGFLQATLAHARVDVATNALDGLTALRAHPADVVISDFRMPGEDGIAFLAKVRERFPRARTMLWTAFPDRALAERAFEEAGAVCYVTKLAPPATLLALVADLLAARRPSVTASHVVVNPHWSG